MKYLKVTIIVGTIIMFDIFADWTKMPNFICANNISQYAL